MKQNLLALGALGILWACGGGSNQNADGTVDGLRRAVAELAARPEHDATRVRVQHVLIAFQGSERSRATRSREAAEQMAAGVFAKASAEGADFAALMKEYSDDPGGGDYVMVTGAPAPGTFARGDMAAAFGDTGWRLAVGEVGVAAYDPERSRFGWHVIKRVE